MLPGPTSFPNAMPGAGTEVILIKPKTFSRRFIVSYHMAADPSVAVRRGFALTLGGAVRASVYRVFERMYGAGAFAIVHDRELEIDLLRVFQTDDGGISAAVTAEALAVANGHRSKIRRVK